MGLRARPTRRWSVACLRPEPQDWKGYARSALVFSGVCVLALYATLRTQGLDPLNPLSLHSGTWDVSFNTATSFVSNTSWQFYAGETTLSGFSQPMSGSRLGHQSSSVGGGLRRLACRSECVGTLGFLQALLIVLVPAALGCRSAA